MAYDAPEPLVLDETLGRWPLPKSHWPTGLIRGRGGRPRDLSATLVLKRGDTGPFHLIVEPSHGHAAMDLDEAPIWSGDALPSDLRTCVERAMAEAVGPGVVAQVLDMGPLMGAPRLSQLNLLFMMKASRILPAIPGWVRKLKTPALRHLLTGYYLRDVFHRLLKASPGNSPMVSWQVPPEMYRMRSRGRRWDGNSLPGPGGRWVAWFGWWYDDALSKGEGHEAGRMTHLLADGRRLRRAAELLDPRGAVDRTLFWEVLYALKDEEQYLQSVKEAEAAARRAPAPRPRPRGRPAHNPVPDLKPMRPMDEALLARLKARSPLDPDPRIRGLSLFIKGRLLVGEDELDRHLEDMFNLLTNGAEDPWHPLPPDEVFPMRHELRSKSPDLQVTPLHSLRLIEGEGRKLNNCLGYNARGYAERVVTGDCSLFRVESKGGERVAVEVGDDGRIVQFYGPRNTRPKMSRSLVRVQAHQGYVPAKLKPNHVNEDILKKALALGRLFSDGRPFTDKVKEAWAVSPKKLRTYIKYLRDAYHRGILSDVSIDSWLPPDQKPIPDPLPPTTPALGPVLRPMADFAVGFIPGEVKLPSNIFP